jgi:hypothetical protein
MLQVQGSQQSSKALRHVGIVPQHYTVSQPRRLRLELNKTCFLRSEWVYKWHTFYWDFLDRKQVLTWSRDFRCCTIRRFITTTTKVSIELLKCNNLENDATAFCGHYAEKEANRKIFFPLNLLNFVCFLIVFKNRDSSASIATDYGLYDWIIGVRIPT